jgi:hypothetical protein
MRRGLIMPSKEVYLNDVAKLVLEFCDTKVYRTQVYNHMTK